MGLRIADEGICYQPVKAVFSYPAWLKDEHSVATPVGSICSQIQRNTSGRLFQVEPEIEVTHFLYKFWVTSIMSF